MARDTRSASAKQASPKKPGQRGAPKRGPIHLAKFKAEYLRNGHNATQAAIAIGHAVRTATHRGYELVRALRASGELQAEAQRVAEEAHLDSVATLRQVSRILHVDPARMFDSGGDLLPIDLMDEDTRAAIQSFEVDHLGRPVKVRFWSKIEAASLAMKHLGLFEKHNSQKRENLAIQINFVGEAEATGQPRDISLQARLVDAPAPKKPNGSNGSNGNGSHHP